jgi:hypothetical protein
MSNVKVGGGGGTVPGELRLDAMKVRMPPDTISSQVDMASGKAKMNFKHAPLGPEQDYENGENANIEGVEDKGGAGMLNSDSGSGRKKTEGKTGGKMGHRSTSGAPGHTITGV